MTEDIRAHAQQPTGHCRLCGTYSKDEPYCTSLEAAVAVSDQRPMGCPWFTAEDRARHTSCGAQTHGHSGAVGIEKRAEQSNPGGGHEEVTGDSQHEKTSDKPLPDDPAPAAGGQFDREGIARAIYDVENRWIKPNFPAGHKFREFDEMEKFERELHYDYADAVLALRTPAECGTPGCADPNCSYANEPAPAVSKLTGVDLLRAFAEAFRSGAQGADMDCDSAKAMAEAIDQTLSQVENARKQAFTEAMDELDKLRTLAATNFKSPNCQGQRGADRTDAFYDAYHAIRRLSDTSTVLGPAVLSEPQTVSEQTPAPELSERWPLGCHSPSSCSRNGRCMYVGCKHDGKDISAIASAFTRPDRETHTSTDGQANG